MKHRYLKVVSSVTISLFTVCGIVYAASVVNITDILGGTEGDTFKLDGKLNTKSLQVRNNAHVKGDLTLDGSLKNVQLAATKVTYDHDDSGLTATTAQAAIDELSQTLADKVNGLSVTTSSITPNVTLDGSTWTATVHDVWDGIYRETSQINEEDITVTFTPTDATSGTFESTPANVFYPYEQIQQENNIGMVTGDYNIVGDMIMVSNVVGTDIMTGTAAQVTIQADGSMVFEETRVSPPAVIILELSS